MAGKITIDEMSNSVIDAYQIDLNPIDSKLDEIDALLSAIEVKLQGEEGLKQQLVTSLTGLGYNVSMENELSELFEIVNGIKQAKGNAVVGDVVEGKTFTNDSGELLTGTLKKSSGTATAAQVLTGYTFSNASGVGLSGSMANNGAKTFTPSASAQTAPAGYYSGITCNAVSNLTAANIKQGVTVGGVAGSFAGNIKTGSNNITTDYSNSSTYTVNIGFAPTTVIVRVYHHKTNPADRYYSFYICSNVLGGTFGIYAYTDSQSYPSTRCDAKFDPTTNALTLTSTGFSLYGVVMLTGSKVDYIAYK